MIKNQREITNRSEKRNHGRQDIGKRDHRDRLPCKMNSTITTKNIEIRDAANSPAKQDASFIIIQKKSITPGAIDECSKKL